MGVSILSDGMEKPFTVRPAADDVVSSLWFLLFLLLILLIFSFLKCTFA